MRFFWAVSICVLASCVSQTPSGEAAIEGLLARGDYLAAISRIERGPKSAEWRLALGILYAYREIDQKGEKADFSKAVEVIREAAPENLEARKLLADYEKRGPQVFFSFPWAHAIGPFPEVQRPRLELARDLAAADRFGTFREICGVSFGAQTQVGPMTGFLSVCRLEAAQGTAMSLYVVSTYEREYGPRVVRLLEGAHSPVMEKSGDRVSILYTSGVNTTCVDEFSVADGEPTFVSTETIAWNDQGVWRKSPSFARYSELFERRDGKR